MSFFHLPMGHTEWHVDRRDLHPPRIATESILRTTRGRRRKTR